jgi:hypothetical protein
MMLPSGGVAIAGLAAVVALSATSACVEGPSFGTSWQGIQGGSTDTTHNFAVGIVASPGGAAGTTVAVCSGALLLPNLVATARHCVTENPPAEAVDCSKATSGAPLPTNEIIVTAQPTMDLRHGTWSAVSAIATPADTTMCGNDLALLTLATPIPLPSYVSPMISPGLASTAPSETVTIIGYGIDTPADTEGMTVGIRRIKESLPLVCVPGDPAFGSCIDAYQGELTGGEFLAGDESTCDGDSGSSAFDQTSFAAGKWVSLGVLSRGGISSDGKTCITPVYERFDTQGAFVIATAKQAAQAGGYAAPPWTASTPPVVGKGGCACAGVSAPRPLALALLAAPLLLAAGRRRSRLSPRA